MLDASRTIHGSRGKILIDGEWQTNLTDCTADVELDKKEVNVLGDTWVRYKQGNYKGTGSIRGYKVSSKMIQQGFERFEVITALEDPEAYGHERIRLKNCMADKIQLVNLKANELVEEETPFTFEGYELVDKIEVK
jgi:hypothetical protein